MTPLKTENWAEIAARRQTGGTRSQLVDILAAAELCDRTARGELFTREQVDSAMNFARGQGIAEGREDMVRRLGGDAL